MDGGRPDLSARAARERSRVLGQEPAEEGERVYADPAGKAKDREVHARKQFKASSRVKFGAQTKG